MGKLIQGEPLSELLGGKTAAIFDMDGTLVDSMWMWKTVDEEYLTRLGIPCPPDIQKAIEGMSFTETAVYFKTTFHIADSIEQIKEDWLAMSLDKYRHEVPAKPGAKRLLAALKTRGIRIGVATSSSREMVAASLGTLGLDAYIDEVTTACEVAAGKPAPDIYLEAAAHLNAEPSACLVFEDIPAGILSAKAARMAVCAVDDRYSAAIRAEKQEMADYFLESFEDLLF